jgi:hypothetical protein
VHSEVIDYAVTCTMESLTPLCKYDTAVTFDVILKNIQRPIVLHYTYNFPTHKMGVNLRWFFCHSGVIDYAVTKIGDYTVNFLGEY